jgi:hypothetical protein
MECARTAITVFSSIKDLWMGREGVLFLLADMFMGVRGFKPHLQHRQIMQSEREHGREGLAHAAGEGQIVSREGRMQGGEREKV